MADLFTVDELAAYLQLELIDDSAAALLLSLATTEIRLYAGPAVYDALTDLSPFKGIALEMAKRAYLNPDGVRERSKSIDDYTESLTFATETFGGVGLTEAEQARVDRILGRSGAAFTVRAIAQPFRPPWRYPHLAHCWPEYD